MDDLLLLLLEEGGLVFTFSNDECSRAIFDRFPPSSFFSYNKKKKSLWIGIPRVLEIKVDLLLCLLGKEKDVDRVLLDSYPVDADRRVEHLDSDVCNMRSENLLLHSLDFKYDYPLPEGMKETARTRRATERMQRVRAERLESVKQFLRPTTTSLLQ